jgi:hypothetical protein
MLLESWLPRDKWHEINYMLVGFGQVLHYSGEMVLAAYANSTRSCVSQHIRDVMSAHWQLKSYALVVGLSPETEKPRPVPGSSR